MARNALCGRSWFFRGFAGYHLLYFIPFAFAFRSTYIFKTILLPRSLVLVHPVTGAFFVFLSGELRFSPGALLPGS